MYGETLHEILRRIKTQLFIHIGEEGLIDARFWPATQTIEWAYVQAQNQSTNIVDLTKLKKPSPLISRCIVNLKEDFRKSRKPNSLICEAIPVCYSNRLPIESSILRRLHDFAKCNSIYFSSDNIILGGIPCRSYHGDINDHWLDSKKYDTNYQPFYPTWILSAYALSLEAKRLGFEEIVDVGSGDGGSLTALIYLV